MPIACNVQACLILWCSALLHDTGVFLQVEDKTLHTQQDYDLLYCHTLFIAVAWSGTSNISEVCLQIVAVDH